MHCLTGLCAFLSPMPFSQVNLLKYDKVCRDLCSVSQAKTCYCFSKICKAKIEFFKYSNDNKCWEEKQTNPTIQLQYLTTQKIRQKKCKLDSGKCCT